MTQKIKTSLTTPTGTGLSPCIQGFSKDVFGIKITKPILSLGNVSLNQKKSSHFQDKVSKYMNHFRWKKFILVIFFNSLAAFHKQRKQDRRVFIRKSFPTIVFVFIVSFFSHYFGRCVLRPFSGATRLSGHRNDST